MSETITERTHAKFVVKVVISLLSQNSKDSLVKPCNSGAGQLRASDIYYDGESILMFVGVCP